MESYQLENLLQFALTIIFIIGFVATVMGFKKKENDNRTKVLLTALEKGQDINPELLAPKKKHGARNKWRLLVLLVLGSGFCIFSLGALIVAIIQTAAEWGTVLDGNVTYYINTSNFFPCVFFLALGIALLSGYFVGKKLLKPEVDKETEEAKK